MHATKCRAAVVLLLQCLVGLRVSLRGLHVFLRNTASCPLPWLLPADS